MFLAAALDAQHAIGAVLPLADHVLNHGRRVLEVGDNTDNSIAATLEEAMNWRANVAEVPRVDNDFDVLVFRRDRPQYGYGIVHGRVVDENMFVLIPADPGHHFANLVVDAEDVG